MANDKRRRPRQTLNVPAWIAAGDDAQPLPCTVVDISETGARLAISDSISAPDEFDLIVARAGRPGRPCNVVWRLHGVIGIEFTAPAQTQARNEGRFGAEVSRGGNEEIVPHCAADFGALMLNDSITAALLRKITTLLADGLRRIRLPLGM